MLRFLLEMGVSSDYLFNIALNWNRKLEEMQQDPHVLILYYFVFCVLVNKFEKKKSPVFIKH